MPGEDALVASELCVSLGGRTVLDGFTLSARSGAITTLLGPNGAGKTTFIRCCTGLLAPTSGTLRVLGATPGSASAGDRIGLMPQSAGAWSGVRPGELLDYLASLYTEPLAVGTLIESLGIDAFVRTPYRRLSGGQQQLVNLAGAIIGRPQLTFLDEPTAGLDPHVRHRVWDLLVDLRAAGVAVLLTTHDMTEAERLSDLVVLIDSGRAVASGTVEELSAGATLEERFLELTSGRERR